MQQGWHAKKRSRQYTSERINTSSQNSYNNESIHVKRAEQSWKNQSHYAKIDKIINQHNQHVNVLNGYSNEA